MAAPPATVPNMSPVAVNGAVTTGGGGGAAVMPGEVKIDVAAMSAHVTAHVTATVRVARLAVCIVAGVLRPV